MPAASGRRTHISLQVDAGYAFLGFILVALIIVGVVFPYYVWHYSAETRSHVIFGFSDGPVELDPLKPVQSLITNDQRIFLYVQLKTELSGDYKDQFKVQYQIMARTGWDIGYPYKSDWFNGFTFANMDEWKSYGTRALYTTPYRAQKGNNVYTLIIPMCDNYYDKCWLLLNPAGDLQNKMTEVNCWTLESWLRQKYHDGDTVQLSFQVRVVDKNGNVIAGPVESSPTFWVLLSSSSAGGSIKITSVSTNYAYQMAIPTQSAVESGVTIINWTYIGILLCVLGIIYLAVFRKKRRR
jgi:hypothetical protein